MSKKGNPYHDIRGRFTDQLTHKVAETHRKSKRLFLSIFEEQTNQPYSNTLKRIEELEKKVNSSPGSGWWAFNPENPHIPKNAGGSISINIDDFKKSNGSFNLKRIQDARIAIAKSKTFSKDQAVEMQDYCLASYKYINWCLRDGASVKDSGGETINSALKFTSKKQFTVYRGLNDEETSSFLSRLKPNEKTSDKAFLSTSTDKRVADSFSKDGVLLELNVKTGVKFGIPLLTSSAQSFNTRAGSNYESEIIFKPNQEIVIKKSERLDSGELYIVAEITS